MIDRLLTRPYFNRGWYFRLTLLIGQSLSLGVTLALLIITANSLFLVDFGSQALPYVYIVVAFAGSLLSFGVGALQQRWSLSRLAITTVSGLAVLFSLSWVGTTILQQRWVSFALVVSFSLVIQIGFIFLGGQAGRLLDVRQIKRLFPQIVAGFVVGFLLGALAIPYLVEFLGSTENVLIGLVLASLIWLAFLVVTSRQFPAELNQTNQSQQAETNQPFIQLLRKPYVLLIFLYQILAAIVSQFSDFMLLAQSAERYTTSDSLAQFFSHFTVGLNITDLLITTLIAGIFLSRFGLGAGLLSNPIVMGILFLGMILIAPLQGINSGLFFLLVVVARIASISLTDGTTRASINTTYQALPSQERVAVQTGVEGIGAPLAVGLVGVTLLIFNAFPGLTILHLLVLSALAVAAWLIVGLKVYQGYKTSLFKMVRRRVLGEAEFSLEDGSTLEAVNHLLQSDKLFQVRQALDTLESAEHSSLDEHLIRLVSHPMPEIRAEALSRIERHHPKVALQVVERAVDLEVDPQVKAAALCALGAIKEAGSVDLLEPYLEAEQPELRQAAMVGMLRYGGIVGVLAAGKLLLSLNVSQDSQERQLAALVIGKVAANNFYQPLLPLLQDEEPAVRKAALLAAAQAPHPHLLEPVINCLSSPVTRSDAADALQSFGVDILPVLEKALAGKSDLTKDVVIRLLRVGGQVKGEQTIARLKELVDHPDDDIRYHVLVCLRQCAYQASSKELPVITQAIQQEAERGMRILLAHQAFGKQDDFQLLVNALEEDLEQVRKRIFLLLSFQHDSQMITQAEKRLAVSDVSEKALAFEILDISLSTETKSLVFPILDPNLHSSKRIEQLARFFPLRELPWENLLQEIIANPTGHWQNEWTRACAIYAAGKSACLVCLPAIESTRETTGVIAETADWAFNQLDS